MRDYLDHRPLKLRGSDSNRAHPLRSFLLFLMLCLGAIGSLFLDRSGLAAPVRGTLEYVIHPVAQSLTQFRDDIVGFWSGVSDVGRLREENALLKHQMSQLQADLIAREQLLIDNIRLREQLHLQEQHPWRMVGAELIARFPDAGRRVITIARGTKDGVHEGMAVVGQTGSDPAALVGIVESVDLHSANVLTIDDLRSQVSVRILYKEVSVLGLIKGQWQHGAPLLLEQLDRTIALEPEVVVVSAGLSKDLHLPLPLRLLPSGIPIGVVEKVLSSPHHTQIGHIRPYVDPDKVRYVWVVLSHVD